MSCRFGVFVFGRGAVNVEYHPDRLTILKRIAERRDALLSEMDVTVFRFVNPRYSSTSELFAGTGALHCSGRWMLKGARLAAYTSKEPETALAESLAAGRYYGFPLEQSTPMVLVSALVRMGRVLNLCNGKTRQRLGLSKEKLLGCDWRAENLDGKEALTQALGWAFAEAGIEGLLVPSVTSQAGTNLIVFPENLDNTNSLKVINEVNWPEF